MKKIVIAIVTTAIVCCTASALRAETTKTAREFRPLEAKKIVFTPAAQVTAGAESQGGVEEVLSSARKHFDLREWDQAIDQFLTVMEHDSKNASAAEGLAMSVYRTGDYKAAYRLSAEFASFMPAISEKIAGVVLADARYMISQGEHEVARELLSHFPKSDLAFAHAHTLVEGAEALAQSVDPDDVMPAARLAGN
jgi:hypothetical protein